MVNAVAKYQKYTEYKDSGVEWLGKIPSHWDMWKLSHAYNEIGSGTTPSTSNEENFEGDIPWITTGELRENVILDTKKKVSKKTIDQFPTLKKYPVGSVAIAMYGATIGRLGIFGIEATTNQACCVMTTSNVLNNKYLFYWLQAFKNEIIQLSSGGGQPNINQEKVASLKVSAPLIDDQIKIANFLDHETAKIDSLIEKQQKLIELLKEKRQAVISHAVTKGLNPDVPMKDSGVEWLGQVPEHWELVPLKHLCTFSGGGTPTKDNLSYWTDGTIPWVSPKDMKTFWLNETQDYITEKAVKESSTNMVEPHSLLMVVRSGILQRTIPIAINTVPVTMNQDMKALKFSKRVIVEYIADLIHGNTAQLLLEWSKDGATVESIEHEYLANSVMPVPPLDEQEAIVEMIARKMQVYKDLTSKAEAQIILLQERRTALISSAVTGKIDVRNWQNPNHNNNEAQMELSQ